MFAGEKRGQLLLPLLITIAPQPHASPSRAKTHVQATATATATATSHSIAAQQGAGTRGAILCTGKRGEQSPGRGVCTTLPTSMGNEFAVTTDDEDDQAGHGEGDRQNG